jgi:hypothetical protein
MPRPTPTIHIGSIEKYQRVRSESGLSSEELLAEQDKMELKLAKKAAARGVRLMGAVKAARRRLLANIRQVTKVELLIGASAVILNPHFLHFVSPYPPDVHLWAAADWPQQPAFLILNSFAPQLRRQVLEQAASRPPFWDTRTR